jgi:hypothetical protein
VESQFIGLEVEDQTVTSISLSQDELANIPVDWTPNLIWGILFASLNPDRSEESYVPYSTHGYPSPIGLNPAGSGQAVPANPGPHPSD